MEFLEERFSDRISFGARGGPAWKTTRVVTESGRRWVDRAWDYPLHRYQVAQAVKTNADFEEVRAFFYVVAGAFEGFRFKDWSDYECTLGNSRLVLADGSPTMWQLARVYTVGAREFVRPIYKPCASPAPQVYRTRAGATTLASATVDTTTGLVSISGHIDGDAYRWVGEFDVPVGFVDDDLEAVIVDKGDDGFLMSWPSIVLEEIRINES